MTWAVVTINPQGHRLGQPASSFDEAWLLAQPPAEQWISLNTKADTELLFAAGSILVTVARHTGGTIRLIHKMA